MRTAALCSICLLGLVSAANSDAGPVILEETGQIQLPLGGSAEDAAVSGESIVISNSAYNDEGTERNWGLFVFKRNAAGAWQQVATLAQQSFGANDPSSRVAMSGNVVASSLDRLRVFEGTATGWTEVLSQATSLPVADLAFRDQTILATHGFCSWSAQPLRRSASGTWQNFGFLQGSDTCGNIYALGDGDVSGNRAIVFNNASEIDGRAEARIFEVGANLPWTRVATLRAPGSPDKRFGPSVAIDGDTALVSGQEFEGIYIFKRDSTGQWLHTGNLPMPENRLGATRLVLRGNLALASYYNIDHRAGAVAVYQRQGNGEFKYVARLVATRRLDTDSLGGFIDVSGNRVVASGNGAARVFDLPSTFTQPAPLEEDFENGSAAAWTSNAGSSFAVAATSQGRVYRQSSVTGDARSVLRGVDWKNQAIEADITPTYFSGSNRWVGLVARYIDEHNYYYLTLRQSNVVELKRMSNGVFWTLTSRPLPVTLNKTYRLRLETIGSSIKAYVDGSVVALADDSDWQGNPSGSPRFGTVGVMMHKARADIDNVYVSPDHYDRHFNTDFGFTDLSAWTQPLGLWAVHSRELHQLDRSGDARALTGAVVEDQIVQVRARATGFAPGAGSRWFGVIARYKDEGNFYYVTLRSSKEISLRKLVNGQTHVLATAPLNVSYQAFNIRLAAVGTSLRVWIDGKQILSAQDTSHSAGRFGLAGYRTSAAFDDFLAYDP